MADSDSKLLEKFLSANDAFAFDQLARRYRGMVFATARRVTGNHHDAEDVAQNCFLELARLGKAVPGSVAGYLHSAATHRSIDKLRENTRRQKYERKAAEGRAELARGEPTGEKSWEELSPEVDLAIEALPDDLRTTMILYYLRGMTDSEIAAEMRLSKSVIMRRLQVGIRRLRSTLSKSGDGKRPVSLGVLTVGLKASSMIPVPASLTAATGRMAMAARIGRPVARVGKLKRVAGMLSAAGGAAAGLGPWLLVPLLTGGSLLASAAIFMRPHAALPGPYDRLKALYTPYLKSDAATEFAWRTAAIKSDLSSYWRGTQPLFFQWCTNHCGDWLSPTQPRWLCQASPLLEDAERLPGEVNAAGSARLPMEVELLQGLITVRLASDRSLSTPGGPAALDVAQTLCAAYREALLHGSESDAADVFETLPKSDTSEPPITSFVDPATGDLQPVVLNNGRVSRFLLPARLNRDQAESLILSAMTRNPGLQTYIGTSRPRVRAVRAQFRYDAVISRGQASFLALLEGQPDARPVILELREQIPSPAELAGAVGADARPAAQRVAEDAAEIASSGGVPLSPAVGWSVSGTTSYTVGPFQPERDVSELRKNRWVDPMLAARVWATHAARTRRQATERKLLAERITPALATELARRSEAYLAVMSADLKAFCGDPRLAGDHELENSAITNWLDESRTSTPGPPGEGTRP